MMGANVPDATALLVPVETPASFRAAMFSLVALVALSPVEDPASFRAVTFSRDAAAEESPVDDPARK